MPQIRVTTETRERLERLRAATPGTGRTIGDLVGLLSLAQPADVPAILARAVVEREGTSDD